jgi:Zinc-binding dehydrogenase
MASPHRRGLTKLSRCLARDLRRGTRSSFPGMPCQAALRSSPVAIDRVFSFDQACDAYAYLAAANHVGKVVIRLV